MDIDLWTLPTLPGNRQVKSYKYVGFGIDEIGRQTLENGTRPRTKVKHARLKPRSSFLPGWRRALAEVDTKKVSRVKGSLPITHTDALGPRARAPAAGRAYTHADAHTETQHPTEITTGIKFLVAAILARPPQRSRRSAVGLGAAFSVRRRNRRACDTAKFIDNSIQITGRACAQLPRFHNYFQCTTPLETYVGWIFIFLPTA
ncbi:hypothetical protein EVAR_8328_1 [Eumeta japonica]|uniref:Uncharacterized protein n=1 Tax=Eumeta variegata TaxID=151549 RepID=A0A4C1VFP1_EUMVA|nr:hypothetical protein EVAR_8328_1 [Eumeta japonica]